MAASTLDRVSDQSSGDKQFEQTFKTLIIGNSGVGKTCLLLRYCDDTFQSALMPTAGLDVKMKTVVRNNRIIKLQIWDTAGQERYRQIIAAYYRNATGFILMYDISDEESFKSVVHWAEQVKNYSSRDIPVVLVGNKSDKREERMVTYDQGKNLGDSLGFPFCETSAKDNTNVKFAFDELIDVICERMTDIIDRSSITESAEDARITGSGNSAVHGKKCAC